MMNRLVNKESPYLDLVASHLRSQIMTMNSVLETIERNHSYEDDYIRESLRTVEQELRRLRRFVNT
jgi:hypothetical protein